MLFENMTRIFYTLILCVSCLFISAQDNMLGLSYQVINGSIEVSWKKGNDLNTHYFELEKLDNENIWHGTKYPRPNFNQLDFHTVDKQLIEADVASFKQAVVINHQLIYLK